jgi:hypothetical protein
VTLKSGGGARARGHKLQMMLYKTRKPSGRGPVVLLSFSEEKHNTGKDESRLDTLRGQGGAGPLRDWGWVLGELLQLHESCCPHETHREGGPRSDIGLLPAIGRVR